MDGAVCARPMNAGEREREKERYGRSREGIVSRGARSKDLRQGRTGNPPCKEGRSTVSTMFECKSMIQCVCVLVVMSKMDVEWCKGYCTLQSRFLAGTAGKSCTTAIDYFASLAKKVSLTRTSQVDRSRVDQDQRRAASIVVIDCSRCWC